MEEKTLITSDQYNAKKILYVFLAIGAALALFVVVRFMNSSSRSYWISHYNEYKIHREAGCPKSFTGYCVSCSVIKNYPSLFLYGLHTRGEKLIPAGTIILLGVLVYFWLRSYELTVTNKRVFGRVAWGKRVDLPVDSVSAIATVSLLKGISVATSSGRISFLLVKNANEIYEVINNLLITRQQEQAQKEAVRSINGTADELKKYKELLDSGIISQEEFEEKKKQLLGL